MADRTGHQTSSRFSSSWRRCRARRARNGPSPTACSTTSGARARGRRGRRGGEDRLDDREPLLPARARTAAPASPSSSARISTPSRREAAIEPVVGEDEIVRNGAGTILGADNKSAVAAMLEATARLVEEGRPHAGVELLFTPKEEVGLLGAAAFDESRLAAKVGYVYDQAGPIGEIILGAPHQQKLDVRFHGRAAHAGMYPEEGRSAIAAAARAIADLRLGRLDEETTANVGRDLGRNGPERRARVVRVRRRGAQPRRAEAGRPDPGDARHGHLRREPRRVRGRDAGLRPLARLPLPAGRRRGPPGCVGARARGPRAGLHPLGRRRRRERLQRARPRSASTSPTG